MREDISEVRKQGASLSSSFSLESFKSNVDCRMLITAALLSSAALLAVAAPAPTLDSRNVISGGGSTKHGAVASEVGVCSEVGISILKAQGNAADAVRTLQIRKKRPHPPRLMINAQTDRFSFHADYCDWTLRGYHQRFSQWSRWRR